MILCAAVGIGLGASYGIVSCNASGHAYDKAEDVPAMEYGLLLGTSPITPRGAHNWYFDNRIKAAAELYHAGKVKKFIASGGDYSGKQKNGCNELEAMRDSLVAHGVPASSILLDYEGLRTINSIVKVKEKLGIDSCIIISQGYHNARALWQADHYGLKAVAYNAAPSPFWKNRVKNIAREVFARPKIFLDLLLGNKPAISGEYIPTNRPLIEHFDEKEITGNAIPPFLEGFTPPSIKEVRDTLVGRFNGLVTDTLVAEPAEEYTFDDVYSGYLAWRVYTTKGTVKDIFFRGFTTGIHFIKEGDLNGDGKDEWGFINEWPTSNWKYYHLFTNVSGEWKDMIDPSSIWLGHVEEPYYRREDIARTSRRKNYIRLKFSDVRDGDVVLIDTLIRVSPSDIKKRNSQ